MPLACLEASDVCHQLDLVLLVLSIWTSYCYPNDFACNNLMHVNINNVVDVGLVIPDIYFSWN